MFCNLLLESYFVLLVQFRQHVGLHAFLVPYKPTRGQTSNKLRNGHCIIWLPTLHIYHEPIKSTLQLGIHH